MDVEYSCVSALGFRIMWCISTWISNFVMYQRMDFEFVVYQHLDFEFSWVSTLRF